MQLNPSEISELIKSRIQGLGTTAESRTQGTVISVTDGICRVHGLADVMQGEMLEFPQNTFGLALNLERDSVGSVVLGAYEHISEGDSVKCTGRILEVPVGEALIGRVVNALGLPIDGTARALPAIGERLTIGIRPRAFEPVNDAGPDAISGTIDVIEPMGAETLLHLNIGPHDLRVVLPRGGGFRPGGRLHVRPLEGQVLVFGTNGRRLPL